MRFGQGALWILYMTVASVVISGSTCAHLTPLSHMVVHARIRYLLNLLHHGAKLTAIVTSNAQTATQKVKILIDPSMRIEAKLQQCALSVLEMVQKANTEYYVADKGHMHTSGKSDVQFLTIYSDKTEVAPASALRSLYMDDDVAALALKGLQQKIAECEEHCATMLAPLGQSRPHPPLQLIPMS